MSQKEKSALQRKMAQEQKLDWRSTNCKLTKGNKEGASFSSKTSGLRLPVVGGRVERYRGEHGQVTGRGGAR